MVSQALARSARCLKAMAYKPNPNPTKRGFPNVARGEHLSPIDFIASTRKDHAKTYDYTASRHVTC